MEKLMTQPQFEELLRKLSDEEFNELETSILESGIIEPIVVWGNMKIIIDGHHRYKIARKHGLNFETRTINFTDAEKAKAWIIKKQRARRNLSKEELTLLIGNEYNQMKNGHGGDRRSEEYTNEVSSVQNEHLKTAEKLAEEHDVSESTVRRMAKEAEVVSQLPETEKKKYLHGSKEEKEEVKKKINGRLYTSKTTEQDRKDDRDIVMSKLESELADGNIPDTDKRLIRKLNKGEVITLRLPKYHHLIFYIVINGLWKQVKLM